MDARARVVIIGFGGLFSLFDIAFKFRLMSLTCILWGVFIGLALGVICSLDITRRLARLLLFDLLSEEDAPLSSHAPISHIWTIGAVAGGYIGDNACVAIAACEGSGPEGSVFISIFSLSSILSLALFIGVDNSLKAQDHQSVYTFPRENPWSFPTLTLSLLTAVSCGQIGGFLGTTVCLAITLAVTSTVYLYEAFGILAVIGLIAVLGVGWVLARLRRKQRRRAYTRRLLADIDYASYPN
jgi:hypothetical protein